jgi:hypothetical protein
MIKDNQILIIKVDKRTNQHYSKFVDTKNKSIEIDAKNLHESSPIKVFVECDICHIEKETPFCSYSKNIKNGGYYSCVKCKWIKTQKTNLEKYGTEFPMKNKEVQQKQKQTNLEKYGCENVSSSQIIKNQKIQTNLSNWGVENVFQSDIIKNKLKQTNLEKYGVEYPLQNEKLLKKSKNTCFKNNGVEYPTQSKKVINKRIDNNLDKYGVEHYTQTDEYKINVNKSNSEKYGSEWYMGSNDFLEKSRNYYMNNFGVEFNMQNEEIYKKAQMSGHKSKIHNETELFYRGSYEKDFLDFCVLNKLKIEKGKKFSYFFDNKKRYYFSDFYLPDKNLVIEIKSDYYLNKYYEMNLAKKASTINNGYNFLFVVNKNYDDFLTFIS